MLRPYSSRTIQLSPREPFRLLDVGLIERIDAQPFTQRDRGVLPAQEFRAEIERIGGEQLRTRRWGIGQPAPHRILNDGNHTASIFAGAFGYELLDPRRERADRGR